MQTGGSYPPFVTSYTYDALNHLIQVSMPRGTTTQTRSFSYNKTVGTTLTVGGDLLSATNPENGTVTYTYDGNHRLATKTDANGTVFTYSFDGFNRAASDRPRGIGAVDPVVVGPVIVRREASNNFCDFANGQYDSRCESKTRCASVSSDGSWSSESRTDLCGGRPKDFNAGPLPLVCEEAGSNAFAPVKQSRDGTCAWCVPQLNNTQIYTHVAIRQLQEIHRATHPAKLERDRRQLEAKLEAEESEDV